MITNDTAASIASLLMKIEAVTLSPEDPYTWSSGLLSPIYCDNRMLMAFPEERKKVIDAFVQMTETLPYQVDVIAGTATAGIPHAAWLSERLNLPMAYVRGSAKGHGKQNRIEGRIKEGDRVLIIEDLISTGGSSIDATEAVRDAGGIVTDIAAIFTYSLPKAKENAEEHQLTIHTITDFDTLIDCAKAEGSLSETDELSLKEWKQDPSSWKTS